MVQLPLNWYYSDWVDAEYKRYLLLAWLSQVKTHFNQSKLYPPLAELVTHFRNLQDFIRLKAELDGEFPRTMSAVDMMNFKIAYQNVVGNDEIMSVIEEIVTYSLPQIQKTLEEGKEIYEFVENLLVMDPVGILPIYRNEGYLIIKDGNDADLSVYAYELKLFENHQTNFRAISTTYLDTYRKGIVNTSENIKIDLIRRFKKLPNPATFFIYSELSFPMEETLLQVVKRKLNHWVTV